jgi:hypothetical protein
MRLTIKHDHPSQPFGGWAFPVEAATLTAPTAKKLIAELGRYRSANGMPPGDPEHEIAMHYRITHPWLIYEDASADPLSEIDQVATFVCRVWVAGVLARASDREIAHRADTCAKCPSRVPIEKPLHPEIARRVYVLGGDPSQPDRCRHHGWICRVAGSLLDTKPFAESDAPENCWGGKEPTYRDDI